MTLETTSYICIASHPVSEWLDLGDDLWATASVDTERTVWELMWWLGSDWLFERISEYFDDDDWDYMVARDMDDALQGAITEMLKTNSPYAEEPSDE